MHLLKRRSYKKGKKKKKTRMKHSWGIHIEKNATLEKTYLNFQASELERTNKVVRFPCSWNTAVTLSEEAYGSEVLRSVLGLRQWGRRALRYPTLEPRTRRRHRHQEAPLPPQPIGISIINPFSQSFITLDL